VATGFTESQRQRAGYTKRRYWRLEREREREREREKERVLTVLESA